MNLGPGSERVGCERERQGVPLRTLFWGLALGIVAVRAGLSFAHLAEILLLPGPNSLGESGKVFFANQITEGEWPFASGLTPPYYPSIHGFFLHAVPGIMGAIGGLDITGLYYAGRAISVMATAAAFALFWRLGRRLGASLPLLGFCLLLWAGSTSLLQHATSFRPDNWVLGLSMLACWLVAVPKRSLARLSALVLLPVVAFHLKATGLVIGAAVLAGLAYRDDARTAVNVAMGQGLLLAISVASLQLVSGGSYWDGLSAAGSVDFSFGYAFTSLVTPTDPVVPLLVLCPLVVAVAAGRRFWRENVVVAVAAIFWGITLGGYFLAASRAGSNTYYFLEPAAFGAIIALAGLVRLHSRSDVERGFYPVAGVVAIALIAVTVNLHAWLTEGRFMTGVWNYSIERTEQVGEARFKVAERINEQDMSCFTDDPGLNVLLHEPQVIYPYLQSQMMETGALPKDLRIRAVRHRTWDCVVISGWLTSYHGTTSLPDSFFTAVRESYTDVQNVDGYEIRLSR